MKHLFTVFTATIGICAATALAAAPERHPVYEPQGKPVRTDAPRVQEGKGLHLAAAVPDARFDRDLLPEKELVCKELKASGWRGERVNMGAVIWTESEHQEQVRFDELVLTGPGQAQVRADVGFLRYTNAWGKLYADIIDSEREQVFVDANACRPLWISVQLPADISPGDYKGTLRVRAAGGKAVGIPVCVTAGENVLPAARDWGVHLDIWQHPHAIARWHGVRPWSEEHMAVMRPYMERLADAGQKVISCSLIDEAWNGQTYDAWPSMVEWVRGDDGRMRYDYTHLDRYVEMMMGLGIREQISCYTMLPWSLKVRYREESTGEYKYLVLEPGKPSFEEIWAPFLRDFREHLREKGWLGITCLAIDERPDAHVLAAIDVIHRHTPEFRIASAVNSPSKLSEHLYYMSPVLTLADYDPALLRARKEAGFLSTFYVCCGPHRPNTFTVSPLAESEWLGLFAAANNLDGFLRWAYNSWNSNPLKSAEFGEWHPGDCWLVYPGNLSSVHFERLRDGLEEYEKIALLRRAAAAPDASPALRQAVRAMDEGLKEIFTVRRSAGYSHAEDLRRAHELIGAAAGAMVSGREGGTSRP